MRISKRTKRKTPEGQLSSDVGDLFHLLRASRKLTFRRLQIGSIGGRTNPSSRGFSDYITACHGCTDLWELKSAKGVLSPDQKRFRNDFMWQRIDYWVPRSVTEVADILFAKHAIQTPYVSLPVRAMGIRERIEFLEHQRQLVREL